jgi:glutamine amidotransferase
LISIIDYGVGNLRSVQKAFELLEIDAVITEDKSVIRESKGIILPGVGAFPDAMKELESKGLTDIIIQEAQKGKPILGICLGMQLLFEVGYEVEETKGLGLIKGSIDKITGDVKIPHMGWNNLEIVNEDTILKGLPRDSYAYFVHSFYATVTNKENLDATTFYGTSIPAVVSNGNVIGIQFHPEKSGEVGMQILKNFGELVK